MIWKLLFFISLIFTALITDMQTMLFLLFVYLLGISIIFVFGGKEKNYIVKTFDLVFTVGGVYMLLCFSYMILNNYKYLLAPDIIKYFLPTTEAYLAKGDYLDSLNLIWGNYNFFNRFQSGYFTYATTFGYISNAFGANFYLGQQISVLLVFSFVAVVIFKLFKVNNFSNNKAHKYAFIICVFSILFFYSSQVLRDVHILLLYLIGIYFTFKKTFSPLTLIKLILTIYLCTTLRLESGLFMVILIPVYLLLTLQNSKRKTIIVGLSIIVGLVSVYLSLSFLPQISAVFNANQDAYTDDLGGGIIGTLQKVPIAGDIASVFYNAVQPVPFWSRFAPGNEAALGKQVYNFMNFPRSIASFFNWMVIVYIVTWLISKKIRLKTKSHITKPLLYQILVGLIFLILQSAVISQRRLMPYYVVFYILFFIIYSSVPKEDKRFLNFIVCIGFFMLQIIGLMFLI